MREKCGREIMVLSDEFRNMEPISRAQVTELLQAWNQGDRTAEEKLWPIVYAELKNMAQRRMRQERDSHTLQTNALVHEVYLRLVDWKDAQWQSRTHFFGMCARIMRQILVDHARTHNYQKRGGGARNAGGDEIAEVADSKSSQMLELDDALTRLAAHYPRQSEVVELRFFGGLSVEETALVLQVSSPTVVRDWGFARAWLSSYMKGDLPPA
jgi:RNA polymerase sigma factor (TIGR02999 family)